MAYRESEVEHAAEQGWPDLVVPVKHPIGGILMLVPAVCAIGAMLPYFLHVSYLVSAILVGAPWLAVSVVRLHRRFRDPGFVFDDTAVRIPPIGVSFFATRVYYADILEIESGHRYSIEIQTKNRRVTREPYAATWDQDLVTIELYTRAARALASKDPTRAASYVEHARIDRERRQRDDQ